MKWSFLSKRALVGEMPDAIGWNRASIPFSSNASYPAPIFWLQDKPFRQKSDLGLGCERFYLTPPRLLDPKVLPPGWGLLEVRKRKVEMIRRSARELRTTAGLGYEMNLSSLLASLRRVEIRIEPQTITDFLKWKNRMQQYNGGAFPTGIEPTRAEHNYFLESGVPDLEPAGTADLDSPEA